MPASLSPHPVTPPELARLVPSGCRQLILVHAEDDHATAARLRSWEMDDAGRWRCVEGPINVRMGRNGMAWGMEKSAPASMHSLRVKREGDGCSPVGVFAILQAFGSGDAPAGLKLPYIRCTPDHLGIDDVRSSHYNRIVDARETTCDWTSPETMIPSNGCYEIGAVIGHNPRRLPGAGSCIFLHVWQGENVPTSGCTALAFADLRRLLQWLDPAKEPHLMQWAGAQCF